MHAIAKWKRPRIYHQIHYLDSARTNNSYRLNLKRNAVLYVCNLPVRYDPSTQCTSIRKKLLEKHKWTMPPRRQYLLTMKRHRQIALTDSEVYNHELRIDSKNSIAWEIFMCYLLFGSFSHRLTDVKCVLSYFVWPLMFVFV